MSDDPELLSRLSVEELEALADGLLAPGAQARLDQLVSKLNDGPLSGVERQELDQMLQSADQLTILKTRARYTLNQLKIGTARS